jgi:hypothetical protein
MRSSTSISATPPLPQPRRKSRRTAPSKSAKAKTRLAYDPVIGAKIYKLLVGSRSLTPAELDDRIHQIRQLATKCHLGPPVWAAIDKMRMRLRTGVHARSADIA